MSTPPPPSRKSRRRVEAVLPPIVTDDSEASRRTRAREDSAPRLLGHVYQRRRAYAKALNKVEDERLAKVQRSLNLSQALMEERVQRQTTRLKRMLDDLDVRRQLRAEQLIKTPRSPVKKRRLRDKPTPLVSNSCPTFAFSSYAVEEPLGRWVRYPHVLPSLEERPQSDDDNEDSVV